MALILSWTSLALPIVYREPFMQNPIASTSHSIHFIMIPVTRAAVQTLPTPSTSAAHQSGPIANSAKSPKSFSGKYSWSTQRVNQNIHDEIAKMPRKAKESRTEHARRISDKFPKLTHTQLADFVGVEPYTISGSALFRKLTPGCRAMMHEQKDKNETKMEFARRLKKLYPYFPHRDYAQVSGAVRSTLFEHPEFQTVTKKVLWARNSVEAQRRIQEKESETAWGVRLHREHGLRWCECSAVTGRKVSVHRSAGKRAGARLGDRMKTEPLPLPRNLGVNDDGIRTPLNSPLAVFTRLQPIAEEQEGADTDTIHHELAEDDVQPSIEIDPLPDLKGDALFLSPIQGQRIASPKVPDFSIKPNHVEIMNIANWMLRAPGSFNNQLGDLVIPLLLNSGELPTNTVIAVTTQGQSTDYFRGENNPITLQEAMPHEYKIELHRVPGETNLATGSAPHAHYNLLHNGLLVPNTSDGNCLYRAILQRNVLMPGHQKLEQIQQAIGNVEGLDEDIQYLRDRAANAFIDAPEFYLERMDRQILATEYAQIAARRAGIDTPAQPSYASSIADVASLASSVSMLSLSEADSPASIVNYSVKEKIKRGMTALLPGILAELREVDTDQPEILLNKIRDSQIVGRAAFGVMSGEAETTGTLVLKEVADILLLILENHPELAANVFTALMPANPEDQVQFANALPLIMGHQAGLTVTQLFNQLSHDSARKQVLINSLRQKHIADRPFPMAYIGSMNFFQRMNIASKRIALLLPAAPQAQPQSEVIKTLMQKTDQIFLLSAQQLKSGGLVEKPSLLNRVRSSLSRPKPSEEPPQTLSLQRVVADKPVVTDDILRQALEADGQSLERFKSQRRSLQTIYYENRAQMDARSSSSLRASATSASLVVGGLSMQNERLRRESNAQREGRDAYDDAQKNVSRVERDFHNVFMGHPAPNLIQPEARLTGDNAFSSIDFTQPISLSPQMPMPIPAQVANLLNNQPTAAQIEEDAITLSQSLPRIPLYDPFMEYDAELYERLARLRESDSVGSIPEFSSDQPETRNRTREALLKD